ncbi:hypothetical protein BY996DRAFT_4581811 [Phakopsora pachyrhizi]|uniref:Pectate lyase superfamily protein domain-containing protein n=1 Tax=Phakopsora pachyrhizi TaxID=170000 RepID=A0AAV0AN27_PHAPC|nr:hypothetical protein BY996DRAFT_4581811 [Phakopsora pachyrhizi]CAH7670281.1 hypothetical protein PPACK8108_LOCUS4997 [Phakopsora pachyrhizi]
MLNLIRSRSEIEDSNSSLSENGIFNGLKFSNSEDSIPDYSYAGYKGGSLKIPIITSVKITLGPSNDQKDRTGDIQAAIDSAASNSGGVIEFQAGDYWLSSDSAIRIPSSVVLRGEVASTLKTVLKVTGSPRNLFEFGDSKATGKVDFSKGFSLIKQAYVGIGAKSAEVENPENFQVGQRIVLHRLVTQKWLEAMNMNDLVRNGKNQTWLAAGTSVQQEREILDIKGKKISWEIPLTDSIDQSMSDNNGSIIAYEPAARIQQSGIENFVINKTESASGLAVGQETILPLMVGAAEDCWVRNVESIGFQQFANLGKSSRRITISDFVVTRDEPTPGGGKGAMPLDITLSGSQALILRGKTIGDQDTGSYIVSTGRLAAGPNVVSGYVATGSTRHIIEPHQRWSTGFLTENSRVGQINLKNRGIMGSGHGWAIGAGVIWSSFATKLTSEDPPMSKNFQVNCKKMKGLDDLPTAERPNQNVGTSLYKIQLSSRIGAEAAEGILQPIS